MGFKISNIFMQENKNNKSNNNRSIIIIITITIIIIIIISSSSSSSSSSKPLFTESTIAGFSLTHNVSRHLSSLSVVGSRSPTPQPTVREKALDVPEHPNSSIENQDQIKMYIDEVCRDAVFCCCKSFLQQAGLGLLISMTVINNMLAKSLSDPKFPLLSEGSGCAKVQGLEAQMSLPEKPVLAEEVLAAQMLFSFMCLFTRSGSREMLVEAISP
nr:protein ARMCX6-like [Rattus norvegicus]